MATKKASAKPTKKVTEQSCAISQIDPSNERVIAEHASPADAAEAVGKPNGHANILLCCGYNHLAGSGVRTAYGYQWRFSDE